MRIQGTFSIRKPLTKENDLRRSHEPNERKKFARAFRLNREGFQKLQAIIGPQIEKDPSMAKRSSGGPIEISTRLAICLRYLAGGSLLDSSMSFGVEEVTAWSIANDVIAAINSKLRIETGYDNKENLHIISKDFMESQKCPLFGWVGAVDGVVVKIQQPRLSECNNPSSYFNRKNYFGIPVQAVADSWYEFLYFSSKCAGSTADSTAFEVTSLSEYLHSSGIPRGFWLAGDEAYACGRNLITAWPSSSLTDERRTFNHTLSTLRVHVEQAFGMIVFR